jgi:hypothetical protein
MPTDAKARAFPGFEEAVGLGPAIEADGEGVSQASLSSFWIVRPARSL